MEKKIAVLSDAEGSPTTMTQVESVIVYERGQKDWQQISAFSCAGMVANTSKDLRILGESIAREIGEVKVILGSGISGASFSALNRVGFLLCESEGISDAFLDELFVELNADEVAKISEKSKSTRESACNTSEKTPKNPRPGELPGHYFINLKEVQQCNPLLSTKKILRPFLMETPFIELVMLCDHVPPWLETDLARFGLIMTSEKVDHNTLKLTVTHAACGM